MSRWKYTSYQEGKKVTSWGLSPFEAVTAIERAMSEPRPYPAEEIRQAAPEPRRAVAATKREPVTTEQLLPAA